MNYLNELYSGVDQGHLAIWHKSSKQTRWFPLSELEDATAYMKQASETGDVYFGWGVQQSPLGSRKRGDSASVCALPGFMFDIDLFSAEGAHATAALPKSPEEVSAFIEEVGFVKPTAIRHSGNGLYYDWLLLSPLILDTKEDNARAADVSRRLQAALIALGNRLHGWKLDNTSDLARVTRVPGTKNCVIRPIAGTDSDATRAAFRRSRAVR